MQNIAGQPSKNLKKILNLPVWVVYLPMLCIKIRTFFLQDRDAHEAKIAAATAAALAAEGKVFNFVNLLKKNP